MKKISTLFLVLLFATIIWGQWSIELTASVPAEDFVKDSLVIGTHPLATSEYDLDFDQAHPPCSPSGPCAYVTMEDELITQSTVNIKSSTEDSLFWMINIVGSVNPGVITWNQSNIPPHTGAHFFIATSYPGLDPDWTTAVNMREDSIINIPVAQIARIRFFTEDIIDEKVITPENHEICTISPNPFNSTTNIEFSIPDGSVGEFRIYNCLGNEIKTIATNLQSGNHTLKWDGTDNDGNKVNTSVYFAAMKIDGELHTKKLLYIK